MKHHLKDKLIVRMLRTFEHLDEQVWFKHYRRKASRLGIRIPKTK